MKEEIAFKFRLPKEQPLYEIYQQAEKMHDALLDFHRFLYSGNRDLTLEDIQGVFKDLMTGIKL